MKVVLPRLAVNTHGQDWFIFSQCIKEIHFLFFLKEQKTKDKNSQAL